MMQLKWVLIVMFLRLIAICVGTQTIYAPLSIGNHVFISGQIHPYRLEKDIRIPTEKIKTLKERFCKITPEQ